MASVWLRTRRGGVVCHGLCHGSISGRPGTTVAIALGVAGERGPGEEIAALTADLRRRVSEGRLDPRAVAATLAQLSRIRRSGLERRRGTDRRVAAVPVEVERRCAPDRRGACDGASDRGGAGRPGMDGADPSLRSG